MGQSMVSGEDFPEQTNPLTIGLDKFCITHYISLGGQFDKLDGFVK